MQFTELIEHLEYLNNQVGQFDCYSIDKTAIKNVILLRFDPRILGRGGNVVYFFCIKNESGIYTSIVEWRENDLVWFTLPDYRKSKVLLNSLKNGMLKIAIEKGWNGRITISHGSDFDASRSLAAKIGFVKITSDSVSFDEYEYSPETNI